ncbi:MAG: putative toxin-antitoxin system toxin component, PIN family [Flammeovirgaceae bacterium]
MQLVFDTSVLISAALGDGFCRKAFEIATKKYALIISSETFTELAVTLEKPRLQRFLNEEDKIDFLANFLILSKPVEITEKVYASRDSKDNMFLELAVSADAKTIVTSDADLLVLHPFKGISIITVSDFLRSY